MGKRIPNQNWACFMCYLKIIKGVLHLLPKISMFCALSQSNQQLFWKINYASCKRLFKGLKNGIDILVGQVIFKL